MQFDEFTVSCYINAPFEHTINAWTTSGGLEKWFLKRADYIRIDDEPRPKAEPCQVGDTYWFEWMENSVETGELLEVRINGITFTFGDEVTVEVNVVVGIRTLVMVTQMQSMEDITTRQKRYTSCLQGWTFYLTNLKSYLEGGLDLRETDADRKDLVNV
jgi:uncharacterized protein YndB with AHSA1/START domain